MLIVAPQDRLLPFSYCTSLSFQLSTAQLIVYACPFGVFIYSSLRPLLLPSSLLQHSTIVGKFTITISSNTADTVPFGPFYAHHHHQCVVISLRIILAALPVLSAIVSAPFCSFQFRALIFSYPKVSPPLRLLPILRLLLRWTTISDQEKEHFQPLKHFFTHCCILTLSIYECQRMPCSGLAMRSRSIHDQQPSSPNIAGDCHLPLLLH